MTANLSTRLSIDASDFKKGAREAQRALEDIRDALDDVDEAASDVGGDELGDEFTKGARKATRALDDIEQGIADVDRAAAQARAGARIGDDIRDGARDATRAIDDVGQRFADLEADAASSRAGDRLADGFRDGARDAERAIAGIETSIGGLEAKAAGNRAGDRLAEGIRDGARKAEGAVDDIGASFDGLEQQAGAAGDQAGLSLTSRLSQSGVPAAAAVGAAIGTAVAVGFGQMLERESAALVLERQFDSGYDEIQRQTEIAASLFADAWGESMEEVAVAVGLVEQQITDLGLASIDATEEISAGALAIADTFGVDVQEVIRSTSQLLQNDLAPSATEALDVVTAGFQDGVNLADDWLESIDEYAQHFEAVGLSADDMFAIFREGMLNGQRDTDKMGDAVKEFRLRATGPIEDVADELARLGISATDFQTKIGQGGASARDAFRDVITRLSVLDDDIAQAQIGVKLLGTQFEDLGPTGLDALLAINDATLDLEGRNAELAGSYTDTTSLLTAMKRTALDAFSPVGEVLRDNALELLDYDNNLDRVTEAYGAVKEATDEGNVSFVEAKAIAAEHVATLEELELAMGLATERGVEFYDNSQDVAEGLRFGREAAEGQAREQAKLADEVNKANRAAEAQEDAAREAAIALDEWKEATDRAFDAQDSLLGLTIDVTEAQWAQDDALATYTSTMETATEEQRAGIGMTRDQETALNDAVLAVDANARALAEQEIAQREANGETVTAEQKQRILRGAFEEVAGSLTGPVRAAIDGHIGRLYAVPTSILSTVGVDLGNSLDRVAAIRNSIANLPKSVYIPVTVTLPGGARVSSEGRYVDEPMLTWVGEDGPEVILPLTKPQRMETLMSIDNVRDTSAEAMIGWAESNAGAGFVDDFAEKMLTGLGYRMYVPPEEPADEIVEPDRPVAPGGRFPITGPATVTEKPVRNPIPPAPAGSPVSAEPLNPTRRVGDFTINANPGPTNVDANVGVIVRVGEAELAAIVEQTVVHTSEALRETR